MENAQSALVLGYAVFWATALAGAGRFHAFDTARFFGRHSDPKARWRVLVGIATLNIAPILWLAFLSWTLNGCATGALAVSLACLAALSVFGFHRMLFAFIASPSTWRCFYSKEQYQYVRGVRPFRQAPSFWAHFAPGLGYLLVPPIPAWCFL